MNEELFFFTIGALFVYGQNMHARIWHIISLSTCYIFTYSLIVRKTSLGHHCNLKIISLGEAAAGTAFLFSEHLSVTRRTSIFHLIIEKTFVILMLFGYFLSLYSAFELCKKRRKEMAFVTTGVYQYIRHPFYFGLFSLVVGASVYLSSYVSAVLTLLYVFTKVRERIASEENDLIQSENTYTEYQKSVPSGFFI